MTEPLPSKKCFLWLGPSVDEIGIDTLEARLRTEVVAAEMGKGDMIDDA